MPDVYKRLLKFWEGQGTMPAAHRATKAEIQEWEQKYAVTLPRDLREYVMRVNGSYAAETLDFDHDMNSLLPLSAMVPEDEWAPGQGAPHRFVFADFLIKSSWWCVELLPEANDTTSFYLGGYPENKLIATSVEEFLEIYMSGQERLHGMPATASLAPRTVTTPIPPFEGFAIYATPQRKKWLGLSGIAAALLLGTYIYGANYLGSHGMDIHWTGWSHSTPEPQTLRFLVESSPNNLDLRQGTDAQSERIGALIYDPLVRKDAHFLLQPWLATSWDRPDPNTWVFHLRPGVHFHTGAPLTSADIAYTLRSLTNGTIITSKGSAFANLDRIDTPDVLTLLLHTKKPDASLLFNLSDGLFGVVQQGAGRDEGLHPNGTGCFKFLSQTQDKEVLLGRNESCWAGVPTIPRVRFEVVPDDITMALELKKGSADVESNAITLDMVHALAPLPNLRIQAGPSSTVIYAQFNVTDPSLRDVRVRQAIAFALDRQPLIDAIWRGQAHVADSLLPPGHWARADSAELAQYPHDLARATALLDAAGLHPDAKGIRLHFTLKTSTDATTRLLAQAVQQQLAAAGIDLTIRPAEFGTFYSDITKGAFQMYILRWTGSSNMDPDIFRYTSSSATFPPKGANRGHYSNSRVDALLAEAASSADDTLRRRNYVEIQKILAVDLPSIPLWYPNNEVVYSPRLTGVTTDPGGNFDFLRTAKLN